jgi:hypothetical protein
MKARRTGAEVVGPGYDGGPGSQAGCSGFHRPLGFPSLLDGTGSCWSGGVRNGLDALPGGDDVLRPGPGRGDLQGSAASAADQAGGGVQDPVAQRRLRLGHGRGRRPGPRTSARTAGCRRSWRRRATPGSARSRARGNAPGRCPSRCGSRLRRGRGRGARRRCRRTGRASPWSRRAGSSPIGSSASRRPLRTGTAARRGAAARGGRRPASSWASPRAGHRRGRRAAARSAR